MNVIKYVVIGLLAMFSSYIQLLSYNRLSGNNKIVVNGKIIISSIISGILICGISYTNDGVSRIILNMFILAISAMFVFDDSFTKSIVNTILCFIIMLIFELTTSCVLMIFKVSNLDVFDSIIALKVGYSLLNLLFLYHIAGLEKTRKGTNYINARIGKNSIVILISIITVILVVFLDYKMVISGNKKIYFSNIAILVSFAFVIIYGIYNNVKSVKEVEKTETLLNFISTYEKKIDEDRINRHEMLNNLLILRSFKDKNTKDFDDTLEDLIKLYDKKGMGVKNINKLPAGLKGMVYYKLEEVQKNDINVNMNISKQVSLSLENMNHKDYVLLCKTMGIILDNAIEASSNSKEKMLNIDVYKEKDDVIIIVDNSYSKKVDLEKLGSKNYSTKGEGRGLGLYIIKNLLKTSKCIILEQTANNKIFTSKITVKQN